MTQTHNLVIPDLIGDPLSKDKAMGSRFRGNDNEIFREGL